MNHQDPLADLLMRCAHRDSDAFEQLYRATSPKLYTLCLCLLKNEDAAEEVLQDAFVKIWDKAYTYDQEKGSVMTWMASVTRNRALDLLRRNCAENSNLSIDNYDLEFSSPNLGPEEITQLDYSTSALVDGLNQLPEQQKECIMLSYYYGYTHHELSQLVNKPLGTVKAWIRRGTQQLRACLE